VELVATIDGVPCRHLLSLPRRLIVLREAIEADRYLLSLRVGPNQPYFGGV
jgi:hypothetical protein